MLWLHIVDTFKVGTMDFTHFYKILNLDSPVRDITFYTAYLEVWRHSIESYKYTSYFYE